MGTDVKIKYNTIITTKTKKLSIADEIMLVLLESNLPIKKSEAIGTEDKVR